MSKRGRHYEFTFHRTVAHAQTCTEKKPLSSMLVEGCWLHRGERKITKWSSMCHDLT